MHGMGRQAVIQQVFIHAETSPRQLSAMTSGGAHSLRKATNTSTTRRARDRFHR